MNFESVNRLNDIANKYSGNLFPVTSNFSIGWKIYCVCLWSFLACSKTLEFWGFIMASKTTLVKDGMIAAVYIIEMFLLIMQLYAHRSYIVRFIRTMDDVLRSQDETIKCILTKNMKLMRIPTKLFCVLGIASATGWHFIQIVSVTWEKNSFFLEDFRTPVFFSYPPLSLTNYLLGSTFVLVSTIYCVAKKFGVDTYMMHLIILMATQYQYLAVKLEELFQDKKLQNHNESTKGKYKMDKRLKKEMRALCQHHTTIIEMSLLLKEILSFNIALMYLTNVFRFCFLGVLFVSSSSLVETIVIIMHTFCFMTEFLIMCICVQYLSDTSQNITDKAFHGNWYRSKPSVKRSFLLLIMANKLECKFTKFTNYNLTLPAFTLILNQAYSFALLFIKIKNEN